MMKITRSLVSGLLVISIVLAINACHSGEVRTYSVVGTISGLNATGLVLQNNGGDSVTVSANASSFQFPTKVREGGAYSVSIATQPAGLDCAVTNGSGSNVSSGISNVDVACKPTTHAIAGTISGLAASGLVLQNKGADDLAVMANGTSFQFSTPIGDGSDYNVTAATQPSGLTCSVSNGSGSNVHAVVTNISVACSPITHVIAGTITGLTTGGLVLQNSSADNLTVAANSTAFQFATRIAAGGGYNVSALSQPIGLTCTVSNGAGANVLTDISDVLITCSASALSIGGTIAGLTGSGLKLQNNGADGLSVAANAAAFTFATPVAYGGLYAVNVLAQPAGQTCSVTQGSAIATTLVTNVVVNCADIITYTLNASAGTDGSLEPNGAIVVNSGASQGFVATPAASYAVDQWLLDGAPVQTGGDVYTLANISSNHALEVTFAQATVTPSVSSLALAVNDTSLNAALTGTPRYIVITNTGSVAATNFSIAYPALPTATTASSTCGSALAGGASCTITITPGSTATSGCTTGIAPTPGTLTVSADNAADSQVDVRVLGYGCIYQGGFIYSIDDTTADSAGIGGTVASMSDQIAAPANGVGPPGIIWSSTDSNGYDAGASIWGIDQRSTPLSPTPNGATAGAPATKIPGQRDCVGNSDGSCNSNNIFAWYSAPNTNPAVDPSYYAAGTCEASIAGYADWYLPAICELGPDSGNHICPTGANVVQSMVTNLPALVQSPCTGSQCLLGNYWSSTQEAAVSGYSAPDAPKVTAWTQYFSQGFYGQGAHGKGELYGVRCARALTP